MESSLDSQDGEKPPRSRWRSFFGRNAGTPGSQTDQTDENGENLPSKWSMGVLNDRETHEVPGVYPTSPHPVPTLRVYVQRANNNDRIRSSPCQPPK